MNNPDLMDHLLLTLRRFIDALHKYGREELYFQEGSHGQEEGDR